jgi:hypothetical protein
MSFPAPILPTCRHFHYSVTQFIARGIRFVNTRISTRCGIPRIQHTQPALPQHKETQDVRLLYAEQVPHERQDAILPKCNTSASGTSRFMCANSATLGRFPTFLARDSLPFANLSQSAPAAASTVLLRAVDLGARIPTDGSFLP